MNAAGLLLPPGADLLRNLGNLAPPQQDRARVAVFGSFLGGFHVLQELLDGPLRHRVDVVGVATDDPNQAFTHASVRLWKYPHSRADELLVPHFARRRGLAVHDGRIRTPNFYQVFLDEWRPELCLMATFGQKIPDVLIRVPRLGFYNFHHSGPIWPSYPGPDPIAAMVRDGRRDLVLTVHRVTNVIDGGEFVARSHPVAIPPGIDAIGMHRITWPQMGGFIHSVVSSLLEAHRPIEEAQPMRLEDAVLPCSFTLQRLQSADCMTDVCRERQRAQRSAGHCRAGLRASRSCAVQLLRVQAPPP